MLSNTSVIDMYNFQVLIASKLFLNQNYKTLSHCGISIHSLTYKFKDPNCLRIAVIIVNCIVFHGQIIETYTLLCVILLLSLLTQISVQVCMYISFLPFYVTFCKVFIFTYLTNCVNQLLLFKSIMQI